MKAEQQTMELHDGTQRKSLAIDELVTLSVYTGFLLVPENHYDMVIRRMEAALGRPVFTYELASDILWKQARDKTREDVRRIVDAAFAANAQERR